MTTSNSNNAFLEEVTISDSDCSDHEEDVQMTTKSGGHQEGRWTSEEHRLFLEGLVLFKNEWKNVQGHIGSRSSTQARSHAQKYFIKIKKDMQGIKDVNEVKYRIDNVFRKELGSNYNPLDRDKFLDIMIKLIYVEEENITYQIEQLETIPKEAKIKDKIKQKMTKEQKELKRKHTIDSSKSKIFNLEHHSTQYEKKKSIEVKSSCVSTHEPSQSCIFKIEKDNTRKQSMELERHYLNQQGRQGIQFNLNKKNGIVPIQEFQPNPSSCINYYTINYVNNATNNYHNTAMNKSNDMLMQTETNQPLQSQQMQTHQMLPLYRNTNNHSNASMNNINTINGDIEGNPFYLPFDTMICPKNGFDSGYNFELNDDFSSYD